MKIIGLLFIALMLFAQEPANTPARADEKGEIGRAKNLPGTEDILAQVAQLKAQVAQKDQQIADMQANIVASQKMFSACFQDLADAEKKVAAAKKAVGDDSTGSIGRE